MHVVELLYNTCTNINVYNLQERLIFAECIWDTYCIAVVVLLECGSMLFGFIIILSCL